MREDPGLMFFKFREIIDARPDYNTQKIYQSWFDLQFSASLWREGVSLQLFCFPFSIQYSINYELFNSLLKIVTVLDNFIYSYSYSFWMCLIKSRVIIFTGLGSLNLFPVYNIFEMSLELIISRISITDRRVSVK